MDNFYETHEIINADLKIAACRFSDYDGETQRMLLKSVAEYSKNWGLKNMIVYLNKNGYTVLNKDNKNYQTAYKVLPKIRPKSEDSFAKCEAAVIKQVSSYSPYGAEIIQILFDFERKLRKKEAADREMLWIEKQIHILDNQPYYFDAVLKGIQKLRGHTVSKGYSHAYNYGVIQGKREERARRKARDEKERSQKPIINQAGKISDTSLTTPFKFTPLSE